MTAQTKVERILIVGGTAALAVPLAVTIIALNLIRPPKPPDPPPHATVIHANPPPDWSAPCHLETTYVEPAQSTG